MMTQGIGMMTRQQVKTHLDLERERLKYMFLILSKASTVSVVWLHLPKTGIWNFYLLSWECFKSLFPSDILNHLLSFKSVGCSSVLKMVILAISSSILSQFGILNSILEEFWRGGETSGKPYQVVEDSVSLLSSQDIRFFIAVQLMANFSFN